MHLRLYRLGRFAATHPWRIIAGWLIGIAVIAALSIGFGETTTDNLEGGLLGREVSPVTDGSAEPGVQALDRVGGVDDAAELGRELEEGHELVPRVVPAGDHRRAIYTASTMPAAEEAFERFASEWRDI